jgi:phenylacetate-CoA ligase
VSLVVELCRFLEATSSKLPDSVKCIVTTSEVLDDYSRSFIEEVTQLRVFNEYGCGEVGSIAHECEAGQLHIMADNLLVEVEASDDLPPGFGHLLVTDLHNLAMPLIRYRLGDLGILSNTSCPCGKPYPILERIVGRAYDLVVGGDGKLYHPEAVIYAFEELKRRGVNLPPYQVVQEADGVLDVRLAGVSSGLTLQVQEQLTALLKVSLDPKIRVTFQNVGGLEREASGKLRVVKRSARAARATV